MVKILKNTTGSDIVIEDLGQYSIPASGQKTIDPIDYLRFARSDDLITEIDSGDILVNNGNVDLSVSDGKAYVKYPDTAEGTSFDNTSNDFVSVTTQSAIEEVMTNSDNSYNAGWHYVPTGEQYEVKENRIASTSKFEKQRGCIKHTGFIKGDR